MTNSQAKMNPSKTQDNQKSGGSSGSTKTQDFAQNSSKNAGGSSQQGSTRKDAPQTAQNGGMSNDPVSRDPKREEEDRPRAGTKKYDE